jgi:hypothetical protein
MLPLAAKSSYGGHDNPAVRRTLISSKRRSAASGVGQSTASAALEQEPDAALRLVDPGLDQTRAGDVTIFVAQSVGLPHTGGKLEIVVTELNQHVERCDVVGIIVQYSLQTGNMSDGADRRSPTLRTRSAIASVVARI